MCGGECFAAQASSELKTLTGETIKVASVDTNVTEDGTLQDSHRPGQAVKVASVDTAVTEDGTLQDSRHPGRAVGRPR